MLPASALLILKDDIIELLIRSIALNVLLLLLFVVVMVVIGVYMGY